MSKKNKAKDFSLASYRTPHLFNAAFGKKLITDFDLQPHNDFYLIGCNGCFETYLSEIIQHHYINYIGHEFQRPRTPSDQETKEIYQNISKQAEELASLIDRLHLNHCLALTKNIQADDFDLTTFSRQLSFLSIEAKALDDKIENTEITRRPKSMKGFYALIANLYDLYKKSTAHHPTPKRQTKAFIQSCLKPVSFPPHIEVSIDAKITEAMKKANRIYQGE